MVLLGSDIDYRNGRDNGGGDYRSKSDRNGETLKRSESPAAIKKILFPALVAVHRLGDSFRGMLDANLASEHRR